MLIARRLLRVAGLILPLVLFAGLAWQGRAVIDDAYINFRIVDHVLDGQGPVYNLGERVEAGTSPAWIGVLALLAGVAGNSHTVLPWASVVAGILAAVAGLGFGLAASQALWRAIGDAHPRWSAPVVPAGAWIVVAVPPFAEFAASGLETGLVMLWIGASAWSLVTAAAGRRSAWRAFVIGLGPIVRPELAMLAAPMLAVLCWTGGRGLRAWTPILAAALVAPALVQLARMGYYAALVPNTALAKEAFEPYWTRGVAYLLDFVSPYWLIVPALPVAVVTVRMLACLPARWRPAALAIVAGGALIAVYVVRLGGDFMHGRMLLPAVFALLLPALTWPIAPPAGTGRAFPVAHVLILLMLPVWAAVCASSLRVPYAGLIAGSGLADEVNFYRAQARHRNPVVPADYRGWEGGPVWVGESLARRAEQRRMLLLDDEEWARGDTLPSRIVTDGVMIGLAGYVAGSKVHIADTVGLTDPIASRLRLDGRGRTGHEKHRLRDWLVARYAAPEALGAAEGAYPQARAAAAALRCGGLAELLEAVTVPLTATRFLENVLAAPRLTRLRIAAQPVAAETELCGASRALPP